MRPDTLHALSLALGFLDGSLRAQRINGGCIHEAYLLSAPRKLEMFVKINQAQQLPAFEAEAAGLAEIAHKTTIRVPRVIQTGTIRNEAFIVMEAIQFQSPRDPLTASSALGQQLAEMHRVDAAMYGWHRDNFIGHTPQLNHPDADWLRFFGENRLKFQLERARLRGLVIPHANALLDRLSLFFDGYEPRPSLLHGDLWSGNVGFDEHSQPVVFDPAVYYGDRETDLAFSELFGGFSPMFYEAYDETYPLHPGYKNRREIYNLYHLLNHYNLFGGHYGESARATIEKLLYRCS